MLKRIPYFYIIRHVKTGKKYAGCRFGKKCNPEEFMKEDGYFTSSKIIKEMIKRGDIFIIETLLTEEECSMSVYEYESIFLQTNDCAKNEDWFNKHNNKKITFGTEEYKLSMVKKYGVPHNYSNGILREKYFEEYKNKNGQYFQKDSKIKTKKKETCIKKYGGVSPASSEIIRNKMQKTYFEKTGYYFPTQNKDTKDLIAKNNIKKYGFANVSSSPEIKNKIKNLALDVANRPIVQAIKKWLKENKKLSSDIELTRNYRYKDDSFLLGIITKYGIVYHV